MNEQVQRKLTALNDDCAALLGRAVQHFYCPILFRDEPADLVQAHVVNQAFPGSSRRWTVQRRDVDNYFGTMFESDFSVLAERGKHQLPDVFASPELARKLRPRILRDGVPISHYRPNAHIPGYHTPIALDNGEPGQVPLVLKIHPSEILDSADARWEIEIRRDLSLPTIVSLLKVAHLTLFEIVGYQYALSSSGRFLGWDVLGSFFDKARSLDRESAYAFAETHFADFVNLVRPILRVPEGLEGTISDGRLYLCTGTPVAWAFVVFVRTGDQMHAVIVPVLEDAESAARFVSFMRRSPPRFEVKIASYTSTQWEVSNQSWFVDWPEADSSQVRRDV